MHFKLKKVKSNQFNFIGNQFNFIGNQFNFIWENLKSKNCIYAFLKKKRLVNRTSEQWTLCPCDCLKHRKAATKHSGHI